MKIISALILISLIGLTILNNDWVKTQTIIEDGLHDIEVINDDIALAYSYGTGKLFKTTNGGEIWAQIHQFDSLWFEQLQFIDENIGSSFTKNQ